MDFENIAIVSTSINPPTVATKKFSELGIPFIIAGDLKTPHNLYKKLPNVIYLTPEYQEAAYKSLSDAVGWNKIQRRNLAFVEAYRRGFEVIATVDDDNIPYDTWGKNIMIGSEVEVDFFKTSIQCFDPLSVTNYPHLWHRGFPIDLITQRDTTYAGKKLITPLVQSDLWDGDPDVDAICRLTYHPVCKFNTEVPFCSETISPFNSQNTFIHRSVLPFYMMLPFTGRMDDIWASYIAQTHMQCNVIYNKATVYQARNEQCLITNLEKECLGYRNTLQIINDPLNYRKYIPDEAMKAFDIYQQEFNN